MISARSGRKSKLGKVHGTDNAATYTTEESEFLIEVNKWKHETGNRFPAATEYLAILKAMGYRKVES